jgi:hypothetical protein
VATPISAGCIFWRIAQVALLQQNGESKRDVEIDFCPLPHRLLSRVDEATRTARLPDKRSRPKASAPTDTIGMQRTQMQKTHAGKQSGRMQRTPNPRGAKFARETREVAEVRLAERKFQISDLRFQTGQCRVTQESDTGLGAQSVIPAKRGKKTWRVRGVRAEIRRAFPQRLYRRRALIETLFSSVKRKLSARAPGRSLGMQMRQALLLGLSFNLYRLRYRRLFLRMSTEPSRLINCLRQGTASARFASRRLLSGSRDESRRKIRVSTPEVNRTDARAICEIRF